MIAILIAFVIPIFQETQESLENPTAESIIARHIEAKGGKNKLLKVKNYAIAGSIEQVIGDERAESAKFKIYQTDGQSLTQITLPDGTVVSYGTDGKIAWSISEHGTASIMKGQEALDFIRHHKTLHESIEWTRQIETITPAGKKTINGVESWHLIFVASDNRQINRYFSVDSGLLIREEQFVGPGNSFLVSEISDYRRCPLGTLVARKRTNSGALSFGGKTEWVVEDVSPNISDIEDHFVLPKSVAKLLAEEKPTEGNPKK